MTFQPDSAKLTYKDGTKFVIENHGRLYSLSTYDNSDSVNCVRSMNEWHQILRHRNYDDIRNLGRVVDGMKVSHYIKQIDSMLPCVCSVRDHKRRQNVVSDTFGYRLVCHLFVLTTF